MLRHFHGARHRTDQQRTRARDVAPMPPSRWCSLRSRASASIRPSADS
ncbi:MAG TPA: hypothetical protein VLI21_16370 [Casimicrobiaceae bacterium]|nr:hypothetical protein [Casimicrobiaceae bacterium]